MNNFKGWLTVFRFTFQQSTKSTAFRVVTSLVTILLIGFIVIVSIFNAKPESELKPLTINAVHILDESGLIPVDFSAWIPQIADERFDDIEFIYSDTTTKAALIQEVTALDEERLAVYIYPQDSGYILEALLPENAMVPYNEAEIILETMVTCFEMNMLGQAGLTMEQFTIVMMPIISSYAKVGEDTSLAAYLIRIIAPLIFGLTLYMMLILYGQNISKEVSTEKTSKLMETLLISVHPYALITGKVLAITTMAIMQFSIWIGAIIVGLFSGNAIASMFYPEYTNTVMEFIQFFRDNIGEFAFSIPALILAFIIFCAGFLFYSVLAGLAGSMVSKPEDVATTQGLFTLPIVISWLVSYLGLLLEREGLMAIARYVPFTSPFSMPVELIVGSVGLLQGIISAAVLLIFSFLVIVLSARIYKGLVLYNGQNISFKLIANILKADSKRAS